MVFACIPRLFFKIMDPLVDQEMAKTEAMIHEDALHPDNQPRSQTFEALVEEPKTT